MKLLTVLGGCQYIRVPHYNLVIGFDNPIDNKLRKWSGDKSATHLNQITKKNHETITHAFR